MTTESSPPTDHRRLPPGQHLTSKFPVMTAGTPEITPTDSWTFELALEMIDEAGEATVTPLLSWSYETFRTLPIEDVVCDIHCVTRWSKLDVAWRGVSIDAVLAAAGYAPSEETPYAQAVCDGGYTANLKLEDLINGQAWIALDLDGAPLPMAHGGPARLLVPKLYFWKSAKWIRQLVLSPWDRKGFWEKLGYHNYGDPWREQRYRGISDADWRRTLDTELSRKIRQERLAKKHGR